MIDYSQYTDSAPLLDELHYWDLPDKYCVLVENLPRKLRFRGTTQSISIGRLKRNFGKDCSIDHCIKALVTWRNKKHSFNITFPFSFINEEYVQLYSLMLSEGSHKGEFKLHVPEEEFHELFAQCLTRLFGPIQIRTTIYRNVKVSIAPKKVSFLVPIPKQIPAFIINNKEFARLYLRIAFEAEANFRYKLLKTGCIQRKIKISRNYGIDGLVDTVLPYREAERIYIGRLKKEFPELVAKIIKNPCPTIVGEKILLKKHFDIETSLYPEYIRINKTTIRRGKISVKWTMNIHGENIDKFVKEIGCITEKKRVVLCRMHLVGKRRSNYTALKIMKTIARGNIFDLNDYALEMFKQGYKYPDVFLSKYKLRNLIERVSSRTYRIL